LFCAGNRRARATGGAEREGQRAYESMKWHVSVTPAGDPIIVSDGLAGGKLQIGRIRYWNLLVGWDFSRT
jgi:hypothetical protein